MIIIFILELSDWFISQRNDLDFSKGDNCEVLLFSTLGKSGQFSLHF